jgi:HK97 family phage major capsid protein
MPEETVNFDVFLKKIQEQTGQVTEVLKKHQKEIDTQGRASIATQQQMADIKSAIEVINTTITEEVAKRQALDAKMQRIGMGGYEPPKSIGQQFTDSDAYKRFVETAGARQSDSVPIKGGFFNREQKTLLTDPTFQAVGNLARPTFLSGIYGPLAPSLNIRDLIPVIPNSSGLIEWSLETAQSGDAAVVVESGSKPEVSFTFDDKISQCKVIAAWVPVSRQVISDVPTLQAYLNGRLIDKLRAKENSELLYGTNTSTSLTGLTTYSGIGTYSWSAGTVGDTMADAILWGMVQCALSEYVATGIVMHPNDWARIKTAKADTSGVYLYTEPNTGGVDRLWGLPVVQTTAITEGTALTGAFAQACELHENWQAQIRITDGYEDFVIKNKLLLLCEERLELIVTRPSAVTLITLDAAPVATS